MTDGEDETGGLPRWAKLLEGPAGMLATMNSVYELNYLMREAADPGILEWFGAAAGLGGLYWVHDAYGDEKDQYSGQTEILYIDGFYEERGNVYLERDGEEDILVISEYEE